MQKIIAVIVCWCWFWQASAQPNITAAEYFIDTDPGFGNATSIPIMPALPNIIDKTFSVSLSLISEGIHTLYLRSKDAGGTWSVTNRFVFFKPAASAGQPAADIIKAEYFFDNDPGFGNAVSVPVTPGTDVQNVNFAAAIDTLAIGVHQLFIRSQSTDGKWSITNRQIFYKPSGSSISVISNIVKAEYFFDADPGFGNAVDVPVTPGADLQNLSFAAALDTLSVGVHQLFIRSQTADGRWSITNRQIFYKPGGNINLPAANIVKAEYYFNTDPGFGNATTIPVSPGIDVQNVSFAAAIDTLAVGVHQLFIRSQSADGKWSVTNRQILYKPNPASGLPPGNITDVEYFIDMDPGIGNAVPLAINPAAALVDYITPINISGLSAGNHKLYIRSRAASGWSITNVYQFPITTLVPPPVIAINSITKKVMCGATEFNLAYHATGTYNSGNTFSVQLSNDAGDFASPIVIGSLTSTVSGIINSTIPLQIPTGSSYRVRVVSSSPAVTGLVSDTVFTLYTQPRFSDTTVFTVCQGETVNLNNVFNTSGFTTVFNTANPAVAPVGNYQLISSNTALCQDTALITVQQDVATWTGTVSSDWHTPGNWNTGRIPTDKTHVIITGITPNPCIISTANAQAASIQVRNGGTVHAINNKTADVKGNCLTLPPN